MIGGVMLPWFTLTAMAVAFVAFDIRSTRESVVLKWGFVLVTAYTGPSVPSSTFSAVASRCTVSTLVDVLVKTLCFDKNEFGSLVSVGAIRLEDEGNALLVSDSVAPFDQWLQRYAGDIHQVLEGDWGIYESHAAYRKRFPTLNRLGVLASGSEASQEYRGRRLDSVILTPLGIRIGDLVLEQLLAATAESDGTNIQ